MKRLSDSLKIDIGLASQALNNGNATGSYFDMSMWRQALAVLSVGAMAATKTAKLEFLQALDATGTGAKGIPSDVGQLATATITANTDVSELTIDTTAGANGNTVTINGVLFTQAAATDAAQRQFANAAGLVTCINDATYGVPGVTASANGAVVTCNGGEPGEVLVTATGHANFIIATTKALAFIELNVSQLDIANGYGYIGTKVITSADTAVCVSLLRGLGRFSPIQKVGASAVI